MFDIIGKRRWYFLFSAILTLPGLLFIILTPITGDKVGLQFTIDYTGGTTWQIRFADPNVSADAVASVFRDNGLQAVVVKQGNGFNVLKAIRHSESPQHRKLVIVLTNYAFSLYRHRCLQAGADFFLDKSREYERLPEVLEAMAEGRTALQDQ